MKKFDGIELLRKYRDGEIDYNTKIKSLSAVGNIYYMHIGSGADKILMENNEPVSTGYLTNADNEFEIIEEEKDIEETNFTYDNTIWETEYQTANDIEKKLINQNCILKNKIDELVREVNKLKKEVKDE